MTVTPGNAFQYAIHYAININFRRRKLPLFIVLISSILIFSAIRINALRSSQTPQITAHNQVKEARVTIQESKIQ